MKTKSEWIDAAARFQAEARSFVDGRFVSSPNAATLEHVNPATGLPQYALALADDELLNRAVDVARRRFDDGAWSRCHPSKRREAFLKLAALIEENSERLALCETLDTGKAIRDLFLRDVPGAATTLRWYAEAVDKIYGETAPVGPGVLATINLQPVGVVGAVIPWNFPIETAFWKVAPALILGNSVVLKPDEKSSRSALLAAALAVEAGIPEGVFNVVTGGAELGRAMGLHPGIDALSFTGSTEVGKKFLEYSAHSNLKMISLECGGKSANVVFADTADLDRAASSAAAGIFFHQGQVCSANSRLLVEDKIADEFVEKLRKEALAYSPGAPLDPETPAGTMIGTSHRDAVLAKIAGGKRDGGRIFGGVTKTVEGCSYPEGRSPMIALQPLAQRPQLGPELGRFDDPEPEREVDEEPRDPVDVAADAQAGAAGGGLDQPDRHGHLFEGLLDGRVEVDDGLGIVGVQGEALGDHGGGVGLVDADEARAGEPHPAHAVESEGAPVVARRVMGDQVPTTVDVHHPIGLDQPVGGVAAAVDVVEPEPFEPAAGLGHQHDGGGVDRRTGAPRDGQGDGPHRVDPVAQVRRHHLLELGQGGHRGLLEAGDVVAGGDAQADDHGDRFVVGEQQRRQRGAGAEPVPAVGPRLGIDRIAELAEVRHVAADGAGGDAHALAELGGGPAGAGLQQREEVEQPGRGRFHP